jgi:hypothetical protein
MVVGRGAQAAVGVVGDEGGGAHRLGAARHLVEVGLGFGGEGEDALAHAVGPRLREQGVEERLVFAQRCGQSVVGGLFALPRGNDERGDGGAGAAAGRVGQ